MTRTIPTLTLILGSLACLHFLSHEALAGSSVIPEQACTSRNSYLEPYLDRKPDGISCPVCTQDRVSNAKTVKDLAENTREAIGVQASPLSAQAPLSAACFKASMELRPSGPGYHYSTCETAHSRARNHPVKSRLSFPPPCITASLVQPVQTALAQTMSCLGIDEHEVFPLFGHESDFQVNIHNKGGIGIGQLTSIAIEDTDLNQHFSGDINKVECRQFKSIFEDSKKNQAPLLREYRAQEAAARVRHRPFEFRSKPANPCVWISQPDNPIKNLLYAGAVYREDKGQAFKLAHELNAPADQQSRIATELARYMYNAGAGTIHGLFTVWKMWELKKLPKKITFADFEKSFRKFVGTPPMSHRLNASYTKLVDQQASEVDKLVKAEPRLRDPGEKGDPKCSE